jgi:hypothetical protein
MMYMQKTHIIWLSMSGILLLVLIFSGGCDEWDQLDPTKPYSTPTPSATATPVPGAGLTGQVVGTVNRQPLSGVTITIQGRSATTDSNGQFSLSQIGAGTFGAMIRGSNIYTRTAAITLTGGSQSIVLDAIERNSSFHLGFYRELARGNHPREGDLYPTHRWTGTNSPTFYIDTNASSTLDGVISQAQRSAVRNVLSQIVPVFTGGVYSAGSIQERWFPDDLCSTSPADCSFDAIPANSFVVSFDDSLIGLSAYGLTITQPDFTSAWTSEINKAVIIVVDDESFYAGITFDEVVAHEAGHGMGFRHTSLLPSVMVAIGEYGGLYSSYDQLHMKIMYSRPAGNTDIDNDPLPGTKMVGEMPGVQVHIDRRRDVQISVEMLERVQSLPGRMPYENLEATHY